MFTITTQEGQELLKVSESFKYFSVSLKKSTKFGKETTNLELKVLSEKFNTEDILKTLLSFLKYRVYVKIWKKEFKGILYEIGKGLNGELLLVVEVE